MTTDQPVGGGQLLIEATLRRHAWLAEGRMDAFRFTLECHGNLTQIEAKLQDIEDLISDPDLISGPMSPGAGPRIYREGYLNGLREAISIISKTASETRN